MELTSFEHYSVTASNLDFTNGQLPQKCVDGRKATYCRVEGDSPWLQLNLYKEDTPIQAIKISNALDGSPMGYLGWYEVRALLDV